LRGREKDILLLEVKVTLDGEVAIGGVIMCCSLVSSGMNSGANRLFWLSSGQVVSL
jgi:hypothetical protein